MEKNDKIESLIEHLNDLIEHSNERFENYCEFLRNEVDICTESQVMLLNNYRDQMFDDIRYYREKCTEVRKDEKLNELKESVKTLREEFLKLKSKQSDTVAAFDEQQLDTIEFNLNSKKQILNDLLFSEKKLVFVDTDLELKVANIGQLGYENNIPEKFSLKNLQGTKPVKVDYVRGKSTGSKSVQKVAICEAFDNLLAVVYTSAVKTLFGIYSFKMNITTYNMNGVHLKEAVSETGVITCISIASTLNRVVIAYELLNKPAVLSAYDEKLQRRALVNFDYCIKALYSQNTKIFIFTTKLLFLHIFNENLQEIFTLGQNLNPNTAFYMTLDCKLSLIENYLITSERQFIRVYKNGYALRTIQVENRTYDHFQALTIVKYLLVDYNERLLLMYDFNGTCNEKFFIKNVANISAAFATKKNHLVILDSNVKSFYIY